MHCSPGWFVGVEIRDAKFSTVPGETHRRRLVRLQIGTTGQIKSESAFKRRLPANIVNGFQNPCKDGSMTL
jgi:hypothetical protein